MCAGADYVLTQENERLEARCQSLEQANGRLAAALTLGFGLQGPGEREDYVKVLEALVDHYRQENVELMEAMRI